MWIFEKFTGLIIVDFQKDLLEVKTLIFKETPPAIIMVFLKDNQRRNHGVFRVIVVECFKTSTKIIMIYVKGPPEL